MNKPYYEHAGITIYHGDCREILPLIDGFDLLLTDPPYIGLKGGYSFSEGGVAQKAQESISVGDKWDASLDWVPLAKAKTRLGAIVLSTYHAVPEVALAFSDWRRAVLLTWYKRNAPCTGKNVPRFDTEFAWGFSKQPGLKWDAFTSTLIDIPKLAAGCMASPERWLESDGKASHPCQKPTALMLALLSIGGDSVCDPFMGTGTTLRAAKDLGLGAIGIETEERYCEIAAKRLAQEVLPLNA